MTKCWEFEKRISDALELSETGSQKNKNNLNLPPPEVSPSMTLRGHNGERAPPEAVDHVTSRRRSINVLAMKAEPQPSCAERGASSVSPGGRVGAR